MSTPRHAFRIATLALTLAGIAVVSTPPAFARGLSGGMSMPSFNVGPRMNMRMSHQLPAVQKSIGDPDKKMLGGPDTKSRPTNPAVIKGFNPQPDPPGSDTFGN